MAEGTPLNSENDDRMFELPVVEPQEKQLDEGGDRYWRSLAQLHNDPDLAADTKEEFFPGASDGPGKTTRRQFMQVMGASMALAGLTACRQPVEHILPYTRQPEEIIPGIPLQYATGIPIQGVLRPVLVQSHEGRPTKVEGNPDHPMSRGSSGVFEQASILNLYDPDRSKTVLRNGEVSSWDDFVGEVGQVLRAGSARVAVLAEPTASPTIERLRGLMQSRFGDLRWITYHDAGEDTLGEGLRQAYGRAVRPLYHFGEAEVIVSLDGDFLSAADQNHVYNAREFADRRKLESENDGLNRLYVVESQYSVTGGAADNRLRLRASEISAVASAIASGLGVGGGASAQLSESARAFVGEVVSDLRSAGSRGLLLAGPTQPAAVHALCAAVNAALGSIGTTVTMLDAGEGAPSQSTAVSELIAEMRGGNVDALLMIGTNPIYSLPPELGFADALANVGASIHLGVHVDETARAVGWHIPRSHALEAWGDGRAYDGTLSVIQPLIAPLYEQTRSDVELLGMLAGQQDISGYDLVRQTWQDSISGSFDEGWRRVVHDGFLANTGYAAIAGAPTAGLSQNGAQQQAAGGIELVIRTDSTVLDGSFANNAWCQELPDPVTKLVWDNAALMSRHTADELGVGARYRRGVYEVDVVRIAAGGQEIELPVWIVPGHPDGTVTVTTGYGRNIAHDRELLPSHIFDTDHRTDIYNRGALANGIGQNVAVLRSADGSAYRLDVSVESTGATYTLVTTQEHHSMEGRPIVRRTTMEEYRNDPLFAGRAEPPVPGGEDWTEYPTLWQNRHPQEQPPQRADRYYQNQWGMVIDLNACTGCNACVVACQSENNIPVVGKGEVAIGREMHWLRVDRYFVGDGADDAEMVFQPMLCQHCDNAPCESVCPVAATYQSPDGTNQMIYNRCIGTRYCSNNCPYKVRRFNFYNWTKTMPASVQMTQNPNVTVRSRGVMEKCTFCVQRFRSSQRQAKLEDRPIADGEVMTACQQACPSRAISFGDLNDPHAEVTNLKRNNRRYELLAYLNTKPRLSYLGRVNNPNPSLQEARPEA